MTKIKFYFISFFLISCFGVQAIYAEQTSKAVNEASKFLDLTPPSVVNKSMTPPSGDKHDFMSIGKYMWPNPNTPDGLPYVYKDGVLNPDWGTYGDTNSIKTMSTAVEKLTQAYTATHQENYAQKAIEFLRAWFLNPDTRMNPNSNYGELDPGKNIGSPGGVMYTMAFDSLVGEIAILEQSPSWGNGEKQQLRDWFGQFLNWLLTNPVALKESANKNNHGSWYDVEVVSIALYLGNTTVAQETLEQAKQKRIARMIEPDGSQPAELRRTLSLGYSLFAVESFFKLAEMGEKVNVDLWHYETPDGRSIKKALDFILPYMDGEQQWPYQQITPLDASSHKEWIHLLRHAATAYNDPKYKEAIKHVSL